MLFVSITFNVFAQSGSVLATGNWYKLGVNADGVYKINHSFLKKMGIDPSKIDPRNIKVFGNPGGMLPQKNSIERVQDLQENAILVIGESDGKFDKNDYILFYVTVMMSIWDFYHVGVWHIVLKLFNVFLSVRLKHGSGVVH